MLKLYQKEMAEKRAKKQTQSSHKAGIMTAILLELFDKSTTHSVCTLVYIVKLSNNSRSCRLFGILKKFMILLKKLLF